VPEQFNNNLKLNDMKTNEQILSEVKENGYITYSQISLLKNRSNKVQKDCINYDSFEGFEIDPESGAKVLSMA
jgi:hypothetical protein